MGLDAYARTVVEFLEWLPPELVVERICGDAPPDYFVGAAWCQDKSAVLAAIDQQFQLRESCQGKKYMAPAAGGLDSRPNMTAE